MGKSGSGGGLDVWVERGNGEVFEQVFQEVGFVEGEGEEQWVRSHVAPYAAQERVWADEFVGMQDDDRAQSGAYFSLEDF